MFGLQLGVQALHDPVDFFPIARVVGARRVVDLAAAAPGVRHGKAHALQLAPAQQGAGVLALRRPL